MNEISPAELLGQIRALSKNLANPAALPADAVGRAEPREDFAKLLTTSLNAVNDAQQAAGDLKHGFENGTTDASLAEVMIAAQKADLSFRAVTEVRNKLVQAYQDIMNMPV